MMWTIKKMLWPKIHTNDPLDHLNAAHNQSLYHWGGSAPFDVFYNPVSKYEQVFHIEPLPYYMSPIRDYSTVMIHANDEKSIREVSILTKEKLPSHYENQSIDQIGQMQIEKNTLLDEYKSQCNLLYFTFHDLAHGDLDKLLNDTYRWLDINPGKQHDTILSVHQRWRAGNQRIWSKYSE